MATDKPKEMTKSMCIPMAFVFGSKGWWMQSLKKQYQARNARPNEHTSGIKLAPQNKRIGDNCNINSRAIDMVLFILVLNNKNKANMPKL